MVMDPFDYTVEPGWGGSKGFMKQQHRERNRRLGKEEIKEQAEVPKMNNQSKEEAQNA